MEIADRALDRIVQQGTFEFVNDFSSQITVKLLFRTMGLPERDHADIRRKVILAVSTDKSVKGRTAGTHRCVQGDHRFYGRGGRRRTRLTDDLITHLAEAEIDGDRLSEREVVLTTATFVMAGVELLSSFMSVFALNLHDYPDARRRLVADPAQIAPAIEELPASIRPHSVSGDLPPARPSYTANIKAAKSRARLRLGKSRRPQIPGPGHFRIDRRPIGHLGFGSGKHFCLGSQMARLVTEVAMRRFLDRVPDYHLTADTIAWNSSSNFRSPTALPFTRG